MPQPDYDVAVLGGGPAGYAAALRAAQRGGHVCLIEADLLGGTCLNRGCIPTKAMLHAAKLAYDISRAGRLGLKVAKPAIDGPALMKRTGQVVSALRKGLSSLLDARKIEIVAGKGKLTAAKTIEVATGKGPRQVKARSIILATGSRPARPDRFGWDSPRVLTTDEATTAADLPESVIIIGGGVIGCEFATIYAELSIPTTVVEMLDSLVSVLEAEASRAVAASLKQRGVKVLTGAKIEQIEADANQARCRLSDGKELSAAAVLIAVGRPANVRRIGLEAVGVELADGVIATDSECRTNVPGIYACGDAAEKLQYAHLATRMGLVAADNAMGYSAGDDRSVVPVCVYTHPEVASVGLSEQTAGEQCEVKTARFSYRASGIAAAYGQTEGQVKLIAEADSGRLLGALVIGARATEMISELALAIRSNLTVEQVAETIHPHPTFSEAVGECADALLGLPLHMLR